MNVKKQFKFTELRDAIQYEVAKEYRRDYNETTSNNITVRDAHNCCIDDCNTLYDVDGKILKIGEFL